MNKHQLASTIWESANQMRSKIEANEYKDFILGFIFYKYLSEREMELFRKEKLTNEEIKKVDEEDVKYASNEYYTGVDRRNPVFFFDKILVSVLNLIRVWSTTHFFQKLTNINA